MRVALCNTGAVIGGLIVGVLCIAAIQTLNYNLFPPAEKLDPNEPEHLVIIMKQMPIWAFLMIELSYVVGSLATGALVAKLASSRHITLALGCGVIFTLAGFANLAMVPHPLWFAMMTSLSYVPSAWMGARWIRAE